MFPTRKAADRAKEIAEQEIAAAGRRTIEEALTAYRAHRAEKGNRPRTIDTEIDRVCRFWDWAQEEDRERPMPAQPTQDRAQTLYEALRARVTQYGRPPSAAEHRACLAAVKRFSKWLVRMKWWKADPFSAVEGTGRVLAGEESKPQPSHDERALLVLLALDLGEQGDAGAAAVLCGLLGGMRATSIASRERRHFDAQGTILRTSGKTEAGTVDLDLIGKTEEEERILSRFRRVLAIQAQDKLPTAPLIGTGHDRFWVLRQVRRLCRMADVPGYCTHALRGAHASAAYEEGQSPAMVARSIGHASAAVTQRHYATASAQAAGGMRRALRSVAQPLHSGPGSSIVTTKEVETPSVREPGVEPGSLSAPDPKSGLSATVRRR